MHSPWPSAASGRRIRRHRLPFLSRPARIPQHPPEDRQDRIVAPAEVHLHDASSGQDECGAQLAFRGHAGIIGWKCFGV